MNPALIKMLVKFLFEHLNYNYMYLIKRTQKDLINNNIYNFTQIRKIFTKHFIPYIYEKKNDQANNQI